MENIIDQDSINFDVNSLWILNISLALVMFGIALEISIKDFKQLANRPKIVLAGVFSQFALLPLVTFLLVILIRPLPSIALGMFMVAACPGGNISNFITSFGKGNTALSITLTGIATLLAVVMTPINLQFWGSLYGPSAAVLKEVAISPLAMIKLVFLLLGLPLVLGMGLNQLRPKLAMQLARYFKIMSLLFFIGLVFLVIHKNKDIFLEYVVYIFWIVVVHNLLAFLTGFSLAKAMRFCKEDVRSITIETGIQNSGLGLLLIFSFFDGLGGMAILVAFWGVWHLISGLGLAIFWRYKLVKKKELV